MAQRERDEFRVGDGVSRAREQIGEADLRTHARGQHAQRQVKRAGRGAKQITRQNFLRVGHLR
jgi:hypothetical protein